MLGDVDVDDDDDSKEFLFSNYTVYELACLGRTKEAKAGPEVAVTYRTLLLINGIHLVVADALMMMMMPSGYLGSFKGISF